jgi:hypothetical protein
VEGMLDICFLIKTFRFAMVRTFGPDPASRGWNIRGCVANVVLAEMYAKE